MNAEISETIKGRYVRFGMQILDILRQLKFFSAGATP